MDYYHVLVIILSSLLAIILLAGTISAFIFIKILKDIRNVTEKASQAADNIEHAAELFRKTSGAAAVTKVIGNAIEMFKEKRSKEK